MPARNRKDCPPKSNNGSSFTIFNTKLCGKGIRFVGRKIAKKSSYKGQLTHSTGFEKDDVVLILTESDYDLVTDKQSKQYKKWENYSFELKPGLWAIPKEDKPLHLAFLANTVLSTQRSQDGAFWVKRETNTKIDISLSDGSYTVNFVATRSISVGDEILLDYESDAKELQIKQQQEEMVAKNPTIVFNQPPKESFRTQQIKHLVKLNEKKKK